MKPLNHSISNRIRTSLLILSLGLSLIFGFLIFLLLYIIEDQVFINQLYVEQSTYQQQNSSQADTWQPSNQHMKLIRNVENLQINLQESVSKQYGIYEFFAQDQAFFILFGNDHKSDYYITFEVTDLLALKKGKYNVILIVLGVTMLIMLIAMFFSIRLSKKVLTPLNNLTTQIQKNGFYDLPKNFSKPFLGDEVGVLATHLEIAIEQAQAAVQREFEFNSGVSHELRTPIQVALNSVELIELTHQGLNKDKTLKRLKRAVVQMEQISEAFLWLASPRALEMEWSCPESIIQSLKFNYSQQYPNQSLITNEKTSVKYYIPKSVLTVILDSLLRNAFQHGEGDIHYLFSKNSFELLNQKPTYQNSKTKGYGVGILIVKRICSRLGWNFNLNENEEGKYQTRIEINRSNCLILDI